MPKISKKVVDILKKGGVGVLPTDTLYGLVGSALNKKTVERIYKLKKRNRKKPFIILIGKPSDLKFFGVKMVSEMCLVRVRHHFWPGPVSVILPCHRRQFFYLHRGLNSLAFRQPNPKWLRTLLEKTGPLVAPSANPENRKLAHSVKQAKKYFGNKVDFYLSGGILDGLASTLVAIEGNRIIVKRQGNTKIRKRSFV